MRGKLIKVKVRATRKNVGCGPVQVRHFAELGSEVAGKFDRIEGNNCVYIGSITPLRFRHCVFLESGLLRMGRKWGEIFDESKMLWIVAGNEGRESEHKEDTDNTEA